MKRVIVTATECNLANRLIAPTQGTHVGGGTHVVIPEDYEARILAGDLVPGCTYAAPTSHAVVTADTLDVLDALETALASSLDGDDETTRAGLVAKLAARHSVKANGAFLEGTFGEPAFHAGPVTMVRTFRLEQANTDAHHHFLTAVFQGAVNLLVLHQGHTGDDPESLRLYIAEGAQDPAWIVEDAVAIWLHVALVVDGVNGTVKSYVIAEGFDPEAPVWLINRTDTYDSASQQAVERLFRRTPFQEGIPWCSIATAKTWEGELSESEILAEFAQRAPVRTTGLHSYYSCDPLLLSDPWEWIDDSGNEHTLGVENANNVTPSYTIVDSQPSGWGA